MTTSSSPRTKLFLIIALGSIASMIVGTSLIQAQAVNAAKAKEAITTSSSSSSSTVATSITTFQNSTHIIITITKPPGKPNEVVPPIVVIPPKQNETTTTPPSNVTAPPANETKPPVAPPSNQTTNETIPANNETTQPPPLVPPISENQTKNETQTGGQNITEILPGQNVTIVPLPPESNITQTNNGTVTVIAPPNQTVTETPANVTVIDPPVAPAPPQTCTCQHANATAPPTGENTTSAAPPNMAEGNASGGLSTSAMKAAQPHHNK